LKQQQAALCAPVTGAAQALHQDPLPLLPLLLVLLFLCLCLLLLLLQG
jgi:hypothetical protein